MKNQREVTYSKRLNMFHWNVIKREAGVVFPIRSIHSAVYIHDIVT